jgi:ribosome-associated protein
MGGMLKVTRNIGIPDEELQEQFVRASGPGGQNVNKVATAVQLRWDAAHSAAIDENIRRRLRELAGSRMTDNGLLIIDARRHRSRERNRADARDRLVRLLRRAARPKRRRRKTRPTKASQRRRIEKKKRRGEKKRLRRPVKRDD